MRDTKTGNNEQKITKVRSLQTILPKITVLIIVCLVILWYLFIGYHNHKVIIKQAENRVVLRSRNSRFEFSLPDLGLILLAISLGIVYFVVTLIRDASINEALRKIIRKYISKFN